MRHSNPWDRALDLRDPALVYLAVAPQRDSLRGDPRFGDRLKRMGLGPGQALRARRLACPRLLESFFGARPSPLSTLFREMFGISPDRTAGSYEEKACRAL